MCNHHSHALRAVEHGAGADEPFGVAGDNGSLGIYWKGSPNLWHGRKGYRPEAIVIHGMEDSLTATDAIYSDPASRVSAHYGIGADGEIHHYAQEEDAAWHMGYAKRTISWPLFKPGVNLNLYTIGLQHEGNGTTPWSEAMLQASAALIRDICARWEIPLDADHVIGHNQVADTDCPGVVVDLARLIALAQAGPHRGMAESRDVHTWGAIDESPRVQVASCGDYSALDFLDMSAPAMAFAEAQALPCAQTYVVASGDTLFQIARRFEITLQELLQLNPQITNPDLIFVGQTLCVPGEAVLPIGAPMPATVGMEPPIGTEIERRSGQVWPGRWIDANPYGSHYQFGIHTGADLNLNFPHWDADRDAPVYAISDGDVTFAQSLGTWGNLVIIHHDALPNGQRIYSRSAHLRTVDVVAGQRVRRGQRIGRVGSASGRFPFHLHFDISPTNVLRNSPGDWPQWDQSRIDRDYVDPQAFLRRNHAVQFG